MPWGNNFSNVRYDGFYRQPQPSAYPQQRQHTGLFQTPLLGSNAQRQPNYSYPQPGFYPQQPIMPAQGAYPQQTGGFAPSQLPDGVQIQPLGSSNMNMLQGLGIKTPVQQPEAAVLAQPEPPTEQIHAEAQAGRTDGLTDRLRDLIQDERNSSRFYGYMADKAPSSVYAGYFRRESDNCGERADKLKDIHNRHSLGVFDPPDAEINMGIDFNTGVTWAVAVESHALKKFGALYENAPDEQAARTVFSQVCGKISHIMMLILIMQNKEVAV